MIHHQLGLCVREGSADAGDGVPMGADRAGSSSSSMCVIRNIVKPCTILVGLSIVVTYCFFAFSIGVIDSHNGDHLYLNKLHPPWPSLHSPVRARRSWRVLQSSVVADVVTRPVEVVVPAEKALQGMGTLFRKGTRPMRELIVAHVSEEMSSSGVVTLRLFLRTLHRSGATARADVVVLFPGADSVSPEVVAVFQQEEASFQKMLALRNPKSLGDSPNATIAPFNWMGFKRAEEEQHARGDVIWGSRRSNESESSSSSASSSSSSACGDSGDNQTLWAGYGSIAAFDMQDLDPHNVLSGFLDDPPAQLRRWVCYEMLLGMVRTKFRNVLVTQANVIFVGDPIAVIRRHPHLYLTAEDRSWQDAEAEELISTISSLPHRSRALREVDHHHPGNPPSKQRTSKGGHAQGLIPSVYGAALWQSLDKAHREKVVVSSSFAMGRIEYVRKLANKMTTEVVRIALEKKTRRPFHDKAVLNYLVHQSSVLGKRVLDHVKIVPNKDSVVHSLAGSKQPHVFWKRRGRDSRYAIIQGLMTPSVNSEIRNRNNIVAEIHTDICQSPAESQAYQDCLAPGHPPGTF